MQRLERVINLLTALLDTERPLTRADIQQRVPGYEGETHAARRTFERDKQMLRDMGLPLVAIELDPDHPEDGTGYRIPKDAYQLPDPELSNDEMAALAVAASAVRLQSQTATAALMKLGGAPEIDVTDDVDLAGEENLTAFFSARRERRSISFDYNGRSRTIDPYHLSFRKGHWYVSGLDHQKGDQRTYRLDRVAGTPATSEPNAFERPPVPSQAWRAAWLIGEGEPVAVRVLVDAAHAPLAIQETGTEVVERTNDDGSVILRLDAVNLDALVSFVLGFLDHAEILEPAEVRDDFVAYVKAMAGADR